MTNELPAVSDANPDEAGVPEPIDEGAVTRMITSEDRITREVPGPEEAITGEFDRSLDEAITGEFEPRDDESLDESRVVEAEPSFTAALSDDDVERLVPALLEDDDAEPVTAKRPIPSEVAGPRPAPRRPTKSLFGLIRPNGAVILLGLVCALAVVELIGAFLEYRERLAAEDWQAVEQLLAPHEGEPVIIASEWLGPSARMHLEQARSWDSMAFPDLRGYPRFWLLAHAGDRPWRGALRAELEQLPRPELIAVHKIGELTLHEYRQAVGELRFSLLDSIRSVQTARGRCSGGDGRWRCKDGSAAIRLIEVDYRVRRCLALELDDGVMATIDLGELELGDHVRGHVGFGDFNSRLRADPSARLELVLDDEVAGRWVFTDDQGWAAFAMATPPGRHRVALRVGTSVGGTWQRDGHRNTPTDSLCVELRGFDGGMQEGGA